MRKENDQNLGQRFTNILGWYLMYKWTLASLLVLIPNFRIEGYKLFDF